MEKLEYLQQDYHQNTVCAGLIVLQTDEVIESELRHWLPNTVSLYHSRIANANDINEASLQAMHEAIPTVCSMFPAQLPLDVVAYCCTSGATLIGESAVEKAVQSVLPNAKVTNPLSAIKARLNHLNAKNIGLLTPYIPSVSNRVSEHLEQHGFTIVSAASFYEEQDSKVCRIASESIEQAVEHIASKAQCDAIFASCTNLRMATIIDDLSARLGIPVVSSNAALSWHIAELGNTTN